MPENREPAGEGDKERHSGHRSMEDLIKASLANPERSSEYVQSEIIKAIRGEEMIPSMDNIAFAAAPRF